MQFSEGFKKYFKNTGWMFAGRVYYLTISFFISIYVIRYLGPTQYGLLSYSLSFIGLFSPILGLGLSGIIVRDLVKFPNEKNLLLGTAFILKFVASIFLSILIFILIFIFKKSIIEKKIIIILLSGFIIDSFIIIEFYYKAYVLSKYMTISKIISLTIISIIKIILIVYKFTILYFVIIIIIEKIIIILIYSLFYHKLKNSFKNWLFNLEKIKILLFQSWPLLLYGVTMSIILKTDQVMIKHMINNNAVGIYAIAIKISNLWYIVPLLIITSIFPALVSSEKKSNGLFNQRLINLYSFLIWTSIGIAIIISIFSSKIIYLLFGEKFIHANKVLVIHIWTGIFMSINLVNNKWFIIKNLQKIYFYRSIIGALLNIILNFILIKYLNIEGAAIASLISFAFISFFGLLLNKKTIKLFIIILKSIFLINILKKIIKAKISE